MTLAVTDYASVTKAMAPGRLLSLHTDADGLDAQARLLDENRVHGSCGVWIGRSRLLLS